MAAATLREHSMQLVMPFARSTSYEPADFIRGAGNEDALALMERWPDWPYSMVLVHGPKGCGKTHLAHVFAARTRATFIAPARIGSAPADQLLTGNHAWVIDGVEAVADAPALAQLINHVRARGDYLLLTATCAAPDLPFTLPDLRSRLLALPTVALGPPDDALLMGLMAKQFADRQLRITPDVLRVAVQHIERNYEAAQGFVRAMDRLSLAHGRAITTALVREAMKNPRWQQG
jgi:chromosomal replication initiation ATPase DnaA